MKPGKQIASARGTFRFVVSLQETDADFEPDKAVGNVIALGDTGLKLVKFDPSTNGLSATWAYSLTPDPRAKIAPWTSITEQVYDDRGKLLQERRLHLTPPYRGEVQSAFKHDGNSYVALPFRVRLSMPIRTKEVTLPFELKDISLP